MTLLKNALRFLGDEAPALGLGLLCLLFLKGQVLWVYKVPTSSMAPTIHGDPEHGDVVLVDKTWDDRAEPSRFDLVVFRRDDPDPLVKRVLGMGGEWIQIRNGDVFVGEKRERLRVLRKHPATHRDLLVRVWSSEFASDFAAIDETWDRGPARTMGRTDVLVLGDSSDIDVDALRGAVSTASLRATRTGGESALSRTHLSTRQAVGGGHGPVMDAGVAFRVSAVRPGGMLHLVYEVGDHALALEYAPDGSVTLCYGDRPFDEIFPPTTTDVSCRGLAPPLVPGTGLAIMFMYLDGAFQLVVDGQRVLEFEVDVVYFREERRPFGPGSSMGPPNALHLGAAGAPLVIDRLELLRDLEYTDQNKKAGRVPEHVPEGHYFLLGDNSRDSKDSRDFGCVPGSAIVGRPLGVVAPLSRLRFFVR
jgi:signal peptidase I